MENRFNSPPETGVETALKTLIVRNYVNSEEKVEILTSAVRAANGGDGEVKVVSFQNLDPEIHEEFDAVILSGADSVIPSSKSFEARRGVMDMVRRRDGPMLGVCFGHQLLAAAYGGHVFELGRGYRGFLGVEAVRDDELFREVANPFTVFQAHRRAVKGLMDGFVHLARGESCEIEAFRHASKPIYGVQFHPERYSPEHTDGLRILRNFLGGAARWR